MSVVKFSELRAQAGQSGACIQRPEDWEWTGKLTPILLVTTFKAVAGDKYTITLAHTDNAGNPVAGREYRLPRENVEAGYYRMPNDYFATPTDKVFPAIIANQDMVITDHLRSFNERVSEGTAIIQTGRGLGGRFQLVMPHQFVLVG